MQVVAAWVAHRLEVASPVDPEDAAIVSGPDSPELEKLRAIKRKREELAYQRDLGLIADASVIRPGLMELARGLRECSTLLVKTFGNEAGNIINERLDDFEEAIDRRIAAGTADGVADAGGDVEDDPPATTADDA